MNRDCRIYYSDRGIPLLFTDSLISRPIITVENYLKWYGVHVVFPDGHVEPFENNDKMRTQAFDLFERRVAHRYHESPYADHVPSPRLLPWLAYFMDYDYHTEAVELITGRSILEDGIIVNSRSNVFTTFCLTCGEKDVFTRPEYMEQCEHCVKKE